MIKAFIFDFDGVIVDSETDKYLKLNELLKESGYKELTDFKSFTGKKTHRILEENYPNMPQKIVESIQYMRRSDLKKTISKPISGIVELINFLSDKYTLAITTGTEKSVVLNHLEFYKINKFDLLITSESYYTSKEDPEAYLVTLKKLKLKASETVVIEDSQAGIDSAKAAGCVVYAIDTYDLGLKNADKYFRNHKEILNSLK